MKTIVWLTGLSGAGKSTLATALAKQLTRVEILDGDEIRKNLSAGLGFTREDRDTNVHRIAYVARLLASHDVTVIAAAISPYRDTRAAIRALAERQGITFLEVFVTAPLETLIARDVKGLYRRALAGELPHFTGVSDPYEAPERPDVTIQTDQLSVEEAVAAIVSAMTSRSAASH